jgi:hypothetical protein
MKFFYIIYFSQTIEVFQKPEENLQKLLPSLQNLGEEIDMKISLIKEKVFDFKGKPSILNRTFYF